MNVFLFLNGGGSDNEFYRQHFIVMRKENDIIICADGGYEVATSIDIQPDYVIGDLDSLNEEGIGKNTQLIKYPVEKDYSDFELALERAIELEPVSVIVYGALGGRKDHELINILLLAYAKVPMSFIEERVEIHNVVGLRGINGKKGMTCSLLCFGNCSIRETKGFLYPLNKENMHPSSRGLSNIITANRASIQIDSGNLVVVINCETGTI
jgi:thiamine pyrophosphokinase